MTVPTCPVHGKPFRKGKFEGNFFCPTKMPDESWCKEGEKYSKSQSRGRSPLPGKDPETARAIAAVQFAGALCHGQGADALPDALACASKAYDLMTSLGAQEGQ